MGIMIQTAGRKTNKRKYLKGPDAPVDSVRIIASSLPNPHGKINLSSIHEQENIDRVKTFLLEASEKKVKAMVSKGVEAIKNKTSVVILCTYGKHRSRAIAQLIGDSFHPSKVYYVHREY